MKNALTAAIVAAVVATGTAGAARVQLHHRSTVYISGAPATVAPGTDAVLTADCPAGTTATGGGASGPGDLRASYPVTTQLVVPRGWRVVIRNDSTQDVYARAYALCG